MSGNAPSGTAQIGGPPGTDDRVPVCSAADVADLAAARVEIDRLRTALADAAARERRLANELQHRVRNLLATIRSITRQSWEEGGNQEEFAQHLQGRLDAVARYQARLGAGRAAGIDVEDVVRDELLQTHLLDSARCTIVGPPVRLYDKVGELFGLAIHELATNAIKFGAFARGGSLTVEWSLEDGTLRFRWYECGVAIASPAPRPSGFGRKLLLEALPYQLGATTAIDLTPGRVICSILLPLSRGGGGPSAELSDASPVFPDQDHPLM